MENQLRPFVFGESLVRVQQDENGEPWFVAKDVCKVLGISDHHQATNSLDDDERGKYTVPTPSGVQEMLTVSESGLYSLVFLARLTLPGFSPISDFKSVRTLLRRTA